MQRPHRSAVQIQAERELLARLEEANRSADRHEAGLSIVRRVFNESGALMQVLMKPWAIERMVNLLARLQRKAVSTDQFVLPGINLPPVIKLLKPDPESNEKQKPLRIPLIDLTLPQLVQYRAELLQGNKRVIEVDKAIALMRKHTRSRKMTLRQVLEKHGQAILDFAEEQRGAGA
jgi:hypothetical protein